MDQQSPCLHASIDLWVAHLDRSGKFKTPPTPGPDQPFKVSACGVLAEGEQSSTIHRGVAGVL